ncbi:AAA family ATPase [Marinobacter alkaliphilus]|uniref:AAA family ATPase n=1 Tax=Marinobacter alkaliphilus TaxID=254719 RepID=A0ABZ3E9V7_9GAMM
MCNHDSYCKKYFYFSEIEDYAEIKRKLVFLLDFMNPIFRFVARFRWTGKLSPYFVTGPLPMRISDFFSKEKRQHKDTTSDFDSPELRKLYELMNHHQVIFLTGKAGTGKTTLTKEVMRTRGKHAALLAPTGIAGFNVGGQTINSFFGFSIGIYDMRDIPISECPNLELFRDLDLLVIDEISMVRADMLDRIDMALRSWRGVDKPFGGVQILLIGDCLQLSPVVSEDEREVFYQLYRLSWWFGSEVMQMVDFEALELTKSHRHPDPVFENILDHIRENRDHREYVAHLNRTCYRDIDPNFQPDLVLTCTNNQADRVNSDHFNSINAPLKTYKANLHGSMSGAGRLPSPEVLSLKVGLQVMITKNIAGAVNGSIGHIVALHDDEVTIKLVRSEQVLRIGRSTWEKVAHKLSQTGIESRVVGEYEQIPLTIGKAVTIHKSQGLTLDAVEIDLGSGAFAAGQTYVALSRCRTIAGIKLTRPIAMKDVRADNNILNFYSFIRDKLREQKTDNVVEFPQEKKAG